MTRAPSDVYARQLFPKKYGIPLFIPEPYDNLPPDYRDQGASIGDVGTVTSDGSFSFVFNICTPSDNPVNCNGVPEGFKQVSLLPGEIAHVNNMFPPGSDVSSASVRKVGLNTGGALNLANGLPNIPVNVSADYSFTSALSEAAILALPAGASRQDLLSINKFRRHAIDNAIRWYEFVNGNLGREAPNGSLYLVTGCDKSTTWGIASVAGATQANALSLRFTAAQLLQASAEYTYSWEAYCPATVRIGPSGPSPLQNQCIFLRGFKLTLREGPMAAWKGPAKVSPILNAKPDCILPGGKGSYIPFMNGGQQSSPSLPNSASGDGHQTMHASSAYHGAFDEVKEEVSSEEDVLLESIPGAAEVYHPSSAIVNHLFACTPEAKVAVTHESEWWDLWEDDNALPTDAVLIGRLRDYYDLSMESECVFLIRTDTGQHGHGCRSSISVAPSSQLHPASSSSIARRNFVLHSSGSSDVQHQPTQHTILGPAQHTQSAMYSNSSPKSQMNEPPYPFTYGTSSQHNEPPVSGPAAGRDSDAPKMPATARMDSYSHTHRRDGLTILPLHSATLSSHHHSSLNVSAGTQAINSLPSQSMPSYPTITLSPSWVSPVPPHSDTPTRRPSIYTRIQPNSFENADDSRKRAALYSVNESSSDIYRFTNNANSSSLPFGTNFVPAMNNEHDRWQYSPMKRMRADREYGSAPRSPSSQSSASHSTSQSNSSSPSSSFPNGISTSGPSANAVSTSTPRKNKMHKCTICGKSFPRPSGLDTHMNSHTGAKPFKCPFSGCDKAFTVRSNAKRHLKTHGLAPSSATTPRPQPTFSVDFEAPNIMYNYDSGGVHPPLKWVQSGPTTQRVTNRLDSPSGSDKIDSMPVSPGPLSMVFPLGPSFKPGRNPEYDAINSYQLGTRQEYFNEGSSRAVMPATSNLRADDSGEVADGKMRIN